MLAVLRIPQDVVGVRSRTNVLADAVGPPSDSRRVEDVGDGVLPIDVVERVLKLRIGIRDIGNVTVLEWPDESAEHEFPDGVVAREVDIERCASVADLRECLRGVVEGGDLDLHPVLGVLCLD